MDNEKLEIKISLKHLIRYSAVFIFAGIFFMSLSFLFAATPNPGHPWTDVGNGNWQVANTQTATRTFTFPDADATVLTSASASTSAFSVLDTLFVGRTSTTTISSSAINIPTGASYQINGTSVLNSTTLGSGVTASSLTSLGTLTSLAVSGASTFTGLVNLSKASTTMLSSFGPSYFGATATSSFDTAGVLTLASPLAMSSGGTGASLTASNGGIVYSGASSLAVLAGTATAGQIVMSGASSAPNWSTATYPSISGSADNIMTSNGTNWVSVTPTTTITQVTRPFGATGAVSASAAQGTNLTIGTLGLFNLEVKTVVNQVTFAATIGGATPSYTVKVCIYNQNGTQKLVDVTSTAMTVTGVKSVTVSPAVTLYPGNYYIFLGEATNSGSGTLTFNTWTSTSIAMLNGASIPAGKTKYEGTIAGRTSGVCDANLFSPGVLTNLNNATPIVRLDN